MLSVFDSNFPIVCNVVVVVLFKDGVYILVCACMRAFVYVEHVRCVTLRSTQANAAVTVRFLLEKCK